MENRGDFLKFLYFILVASVVSLDFFTKLWAVNFLKDIDGVELIPGFLRLIYVENRGAAFGILKDARFFFIILTLLVFVGIFFLVKKYQKKITPLTAFLIAFFLAGTVGNFIDRVRFGYVVDFISLKFGSYCFPVFNVADIAITISVLLFTFLSITGRVDLDD